MATSRTKPLASNMDESTVDEQVHCWACRALIVIPVLDGAKANIYKCGWCGAINPKLKRANELCHERLPKPDLAPKPSTSTFGRWCDKAEECLESLFCCTCSGWVIQFMCSLIVVLTSCLIGSVGVFGVYPVLYNLCSSPYVFALNTGMALFLEFNIFFNYFSAVLRKAGPVTDFFDLNLAISGHESRDRFIDFTFCDKCDKPKPPNTHHCSACSDCVVDMDHHCPYINNCVGRGNLRNFLLFLLWVTAAMLYAIPVYAMSVYRHGATFMAAMAQGTKLRRRGATLGMPMQLVYFLATLPTPVFISFVMLVICVLVFIMVGMLCVRHWMLAAQGSTYVGRLKGEKVAQGGALANLQYVFGASNPAFWLLPTLRNPCGVSKGDKGA